MNWNPFSHSVRSIMHCTTIDLSVIYTFVPLMSIFLAAYNSLTIAMRQICNLACKLVQKGIGPAPDLTLMGEDHTARHRWNGLLSDRQQSSSKTLQQSVPHRTHTSSQWHQNGHSRCEALWELTTDGGRTEVPRCMGRWRQRSRLMSWRPVSSMPLPSLLSLFSLSYLESEALR